MRRPHSDTPLFPVPRHPSPIASIRIAAGEHLLHVRTNAGAPLRPELPPLVLVHGLVISSLYHVPLARRLAPVVRLSAVDQPGFG